MIQYYPIMAFPFVALLEWIGKTKWLKYLAYIAFALCIYLNIWWVYHAHRGSLLDAGNMTKAYYWRVIGKWEAPEETRKLLDTDELFEDERKKVTVLYSNDFEQDSSAFTEGPVIQGKRFFKVDQEHQFTPKSSFALSPGDASWLRVSGSFSIPQKEWNFWMMPQLVVNFTNQGEVVKSRSIRLHRFLSDGQTKRLYIDVKVPTKAFDQVETYLWNADGHKTTYFDELVVEKFE